MSRFFFFFIQTYSFTFTPGEADLIPSVCVVALCMMGSEADDGVNRSHSDYIEWIVEII